MQRTCTEARATDRSSIFHISRQSEAPRCCVPIALISTPITIIEGLESLIGNQGGAPAVAVIWVGAETLRGSQ